MRVSEPGCGENIKTNDGARLFVPVHLLDFAGSVTFRMREQAAFELSGYSSMEEFETACSEACLRFPLLASVRVLVRRKTGGASEHAPVSQTDPSEVTAGGGDVSGMGQAECSECCRSRVVCILATFV